MPWLPWKSTPKESNPGPTPVQQSTTEPDQEARSSLGIRYDDPMVLEHSTNVVANRVGTKSDDRNDNVPNLSLHVHSSQPRGNKRLKDEDEDMDDVDPSIVNVKKRRSPSVSSRARSPPPTGHLESASPPASPIENTTFHDSYYEDDDAWADTKLLKDLETRAITVSQLIQEVKGIYAGLVMVEKKCIEIVTQQSETPTKLSKEQWQALIALHRTLLNEHHDFFSASHHPITAGHELRDLAARYAMPARMWRHGIHAFLELLRNRLPDSLEHMLSFVYLSYSMMALLKETVPDFLETWIECLGDLARYRMAIEEADLRDRENWSNTARTWYNEAADLSPSTGRIQHHLAVLARPNIVQQLYLYSKALVAAVPFKNAGESILLLYNPLLDQAGSSTSRYQPAEFNLVCVGAVLFKRLSVAEFEVYRSVFASHLDAHMSRSGSRFVVQGPEIAGSLFAMLMDFGNPDNTLWSMLHSHQQQLKVRYCEEKNLEAEKLPKDFVVNDPGIIDPIRQAYWNKEVKQEIRIRSPALPSDGSFSKSDEISSYVGPMLYKTIADVAGHIGNKNVVPFMHTTLAYLNALTWIPGASVYIEKFIPWEKVEQFLNTVGRSGVSYENVESDEFPKSFGGNKRQLPEDFVMRGLMAMTYYYKPSFFDDRVDEDERLLEQPSHQAPRVERCLYSAIQLAKLKRWLHYDPKTKHFRTTCFARSLYKE